MSIPIEEEEVPSKSQSHWIKSFQKQDDEELISTKMTTAPFTLHHQQVHSIHPTIDSSITHNLH